MQLIPLITSSIFAVTVFAGCDKISTAKIDELGAVNSSYVGAERMSLQSKNSYLLTWSDAQIATNKKDVSYDIYALKIVDQTGYPETLFSSPGEAIDDSGVYLSAALPDAIAPIGKGAKIGTAVNKTAFQIDPTFLSSAGTYLFQVRINMQAAGLKKPDLNTRVVAFRYGVVVSKNLTAFSGCTSAAAISTSSAVISFPFPSTVDKVDIFRDGIIVSTLDNSSITTFTDKNLKQGDTYSYECQATSGTDKKKGLPQSVTIPAVIPPTFTGITALTAPSSSSLLASWALATGTTTYQYNVYCSAGSSIDWTASPMAVIAASTGATSAVLTGLGDEIPYTCGVRACAYGNVCDANTATLLKTLPDAGAPRSQGISTVVLTNGKLVVSAPWSLSNGAILKRRIYVCTGNYATCGTTIANYSLAATVVSSQVYAPSTSITLSSFVVTHNTTYSVLMTDEDPSGHVAGAQATPAIVTTGDLTKPIFSGLSSISSGTPTNLSDTSITLNFTAVDREIDDNVGGASHYQIYSITGTGDACVSGSLLSEFSSAAYTSGVSYTYLVNGLAPRTVYSFCLKARDTAGNVSSTAQYYTRQTQDVTAPTFDQGQGLVYDSATGYFTVSWNRSLSSDRSTYKLYIRKNGGAYSTYTYSDATYPTGISFTKTSLGFTFADLDTLNFYAIACDDAGTIPGGTDNCSSAPAQPDTYSVPDVSPPSGFAGIDTTNTVNSGQGSVTVAWAAPSPAGMWSSEGYRGFIVYTVDSSNNITQIKDCACVQSNCSDQRTSCTVTGLDARRTYKFHVRAYDQALNVTTSLSPASSVASVQTLDTTAPTFNGNVQAGIVSAAVQVTWSTASDNQYPTESVATVTYQVYRKTGSNFGSLSSPESDMDGGYPVIKTTNSYTESGTTAGITYYYAVCAKDASNNRTCAQSSASIAPPDLIPPVINSLATNKTSTVKTWNLSWSMSDTATAFGNLTVQIYRSYSATAGTATTADTLIYSGQGVSSRTGFTGRPNVNEYVNYLVVITDAANNQASATLSVYSANEVLITSLTRNAGTTTGGKFILIFGSGFDTTATVTIGGVACTNGVVYYTSNRMGCKTPAASAGVVNVVVTNSDGSTVSAPYTYYTYTGAGTDNVCDNPTQPTTTFYNPAGAGSLADPFLICTPTQFALIGPAASSKYFKMMDNLDVSTEPANTFGSISFTNKNLIGNDMVIANWTRSGTSGLINDPIFGYPQLGLFTTASGSISNLGLLNVNLTNVTGTGMTGAIAGYSTGLTTTNVYAQGTITGAGSTYIVYIGGLYGFVRAGNSHTGDRFHGTVSATTTETVNSGSGGLIGYMQDQGAGSTITNCYTTGTVSFASNFVGGLIGRVGSSSTTTDEALSGNYSTATVSGGGSVGGLIGSLGLGSAGRTTTFSSNYATGSVTATGSRVGGLIGISSSTVSHAAAITNSYATGNVSGAGEVGGFIGNFEGRLACGSGPCVVLSGSYATGNVTATAASSGGFVGTFAGLRGNPYQATITNSYATGNVTSSSSAVGGFAGTTSFGISISSSRATGSVSGTTGVGGFVGSTGYNNVAFVTSVDFLNNYSTGTVSAIGTGNTQAGGFIGMVTTCASGTALGPTITIAKSYTASNVNGISANGGFIGYIDPSTTACADSGLTVTVNDSYSKGTLVTSAGTNNGGFVGSSIARLTLNRVFAVGAMTVSGGGSGLVGGGVAPTVTDSFWDTQTTLQSGTFGSVGTGKTTTQMKTQATFTNFDFSTTPVWKFVTGQYPLLNWQ